jgi:hypothetical protein
MKSTDQAHDRTGDDEQRAADEATAEPAWTPPEKSDQPPGEETVQVNDAYAGGGPPPGDESQLNDAQHPTGG